MTAARIDHLVTSGAFSLDGGTWEVDNNVWIAGNDTEAIWIDAAHDADAIAAALGGRTLRVIVHTHADNDHIDVAPALAPATGAPSSPTPTTCRCGSRPTPTARRTANSRTARC